MSDKLTAEINLGPEWLRRGNGGKVANATGGGDRENGTNGIKYERGVMLLLFRALDLPKNRLAPKVRRPVVHVGEMPEEPPDQACFSAMSITSLVTEGILPSSTLSDGAALSSASYPRRGEVREGGGRRARGRGRGVLGRRADDDDPDGRPEDELGADASPAATPDDSSRRDRMASSDGREVPALPPPSRPARMPGSPGSRSPAGRSPDEAFDVRTPVRQPAEDDRNEETTPRRADFRETPEGGRHLNMNMNRTPPKAKFAATFGHAWDNDEGESLFFEDDEEDSGGTGKTTNHGRSFLERVLKKKLDDEADAAAEAALNSGGLSVVADRIPLPKSPSSPSRAHTQGAQQPAPVAAPTSPAPPAARAARPPMPSERPPPPPSPPPAPPTNGIAFQQASKARLNLERHIPQTPPQTPPNNLHVSSGAAPTASPALATMPPGPAPASAPLAPASQATPVVPSPAPTAVPVAPAPTAPAPSAPAVAPLVGSPSSPDARHIVNPPPQQGLGFAQAVALQSRHVGGMTAAPNAPLRTSLNLASALPAAAASPGHGRVEEAGHVAVARLAQGRSPGPQSGFQGYGGGNAAPGAPQRSPAQNAPQALPVNASPNAVYSLHAQTLSSAPQDSYQGSRYDAKIEEQPIQDLRTKCWWYRDPQGVVQGPFSTSEMRHWQQCGYFQADLPIRYTESGAFYPLRVLFPPPMVPFHSFPAIAAPAPAATAPGGQWPRQLLGTDATPSVASAAQPLGDMSEFSMRLKAQGGLDGAYDTSAGRGPAMPDASRGLATGMMLHNVAAASRGWLHWVPGEELKASGTPGSMAANSLSGYPASLAPQQAADAMHGRAMMPMVGPGVHARTDAALALGLGANAATAEALAAARLEAVREGDRQARHTRKQPGDQHKQIVPTDMARPVGEGTIGANWVMDQGPPMQVAANSPPVNISSAQEFPTLGGSPAERVVMADAAGGSGGFWERPPRPVRVPGPSEAVGSTLNSTTPGATAGSTPIGPQTTGGASTGIAGLSAPPSHSPREDVARRSGDDHGDDRRAQMEDLLKQCNLHLDEPFIGFLLTLTSASDVFDYLQAYHGDGENVRRFAEGFTERRLGLPHQETKAAAPEREAAAKGTKEGVDANTPKASRRRRGKGREVDPSLLGFTATSSRIMQGIIDHGD